MTSFQIGYQFMSENYVNYYFGVGEGESNIFSAYNSDATTNKFISASNLYSFTKELKGIISLRFRDHGDEVLNSPTVRKSESLTGVIFLLYEL